MKLYNWHKVEGITAEILEENKLREFMVADKKIGLLKRSDAIYAFTSRCPHASANLCDGWLDARGHIICPEHKYRFDPVNGRNVSGEGYKLFTYPVEIRDNGIFIGFVSAD